MGLWSLQIQSAVEFDEKTPDTIFVKNGTESLDLPCGEISEDVIGIEWFMYKSYYLIKILKFYHTTSDTSPIYYNGYTANKYGISDSVNTSLVVKRINLSDTGWFTCRTVGTVHYHHNTTITVVCKLLLKYLVLGRITQ